MPRELRTALAGLREPERSLWLEYHDLRDRGLRRDALARLRTLVARVRSYAPAERHRWIEAVAVAAFDDPSRFERATLPHPLLHGLVIPELVRGYEERKPGYARWLAAARLPDAAFDPLRLLRVALQQDPADAVARDDLISLRDAELWWRVEYVPAEVFDRDEDAWRENLQEFKTLITERGGNEQWLPELRWYELHFAAWHDFRASGFRRYEAFLDATRPGWRDVDPYPFP